LRQQLRLVVLIDIRDLFRRQLVICLALDSPEDDLVSERKPNGLIVILQILALHSEYFDVVQLGDVVCHLVALLHAVLE